MSCCGQQRAALAGGGATNISESEPPVWISYAGVRTILVKGGATGHIYRFVPGGMLRVNASDAPSMRDIPGLKRREASHNPQDAVPS
jgi:hypothetical protein